MENNRLILAQDNLYKSDVKNLDKNLKNLIKTQKEIVMAHRIDDELER